jgi:hypothetical protein
MVSLGALWLPILVSAIAVFFAGFILRMVLPHHWSDFQGVKDEDGLIKALAGHNLGAGQYNFPHCTSAAAMKDPAWQKKMAEGPAGWMVILPKGTPSMGKPLGLQLLYCVILSFFVAYVGHETLHAGDSFIRVLQIAGTVAVLAHIGAIAPHSIWMGRPWLVSIKEIIDGIIYGLVTGAVFAAMWPA